MSDDLFTQRQIVIDDLLLTYYQKVTKPSNPNLVFLHGWRSESKLWFSVVRKIVGERYNAYCLDLPGFGSSQKPPSTFTLGNYADVVQKFVEKLRLNDVTLIGHSFGGNIALKIVIDRLLPVKNVILVDSSGVRPNTVTKTVKKGIARMVKPIFQISALKDLRYKIYQQMGAEDYIATPELTEIYKNIVGVDLTPHLSQVLVPVCIIWGEQDNDTPVWQARVMQKQISNSELHILSDASHYSFLDQQDEFASKVTAFLEKKSAQSNS
jgi:pimeloyl-ACP methyl ester carboxylesterase